MLSRLGLFLSDPLLSELFTKANLKYENYIFFQEHLVYQKINQILQLLAYKFRTSIHLRKR